MSNTTHRKRLARLFADRTGRPYAQALDVVKAAAAAGRLPEPLDEHGLHRALKALLAAEAQAPDAYAAPALVDGAPAAERSLYLIPPFLATLRMVWQGRVAKERHLRDRTRYTIDNKRASDARDTELALLERDGYISARLLDPDDWVVARLTDFGDEVLAANHADTDKFHDGLPAGAGLDEPDRNPYVGRGADGARRSAEIDRTEADGLDRTDPRYDEVLASAERWERQAARIEQQRTGEQAETATPVTAALRDVEWEPFGTTEGARREASSPANQRIWDLSWVYEHLTGEQGLVHVSSPGSGADRYVFGGRHTALGHREALEHISGLVEALRGRDDLVWPPAESGPAGFGVSGANAVKAALERKRSSDPAPGEEVVTVNGVTYDLSDPAARAAAYGDGGDDPTQYDEPGQPAT